ncbi:trehalose-phosphatase [Novosphingobium aerophilum]|uniref:trehalose-phosphatase n=1 Tax=Novosphingobium TaxID=165696 RepID=UPI002D790D46|nr:trehalose-phosphatase [Novosphingobium sp. RL4]WRT93746.1 trehalose-phosphatase [Novosphingobium sp. RL4]
MTDPGECPSLAEHGAFPRDLPPPLPLGAAVPTALFLDFDGTLVEIADHPDDVIVSPHLPDLIARLADRLDGRLALITGRSLESLEEMLGHLDVAAAGSHGGEFRPAGSREILPLAEPLPKAVVDRLSAFAADNGGLLVEPKPFSIAVHYRRHPEALPGLLACADETGREFGLRTKHGKQVIELSMPGSDKGSAVARFMQMPPFLGARPVFIGDDVTDEDAFAAVARLGGDGILAGPMRETLAHARLGGVSAVHAWLETIIHDHDQENSRT